MLNQKLAIGAAILGAFVLGTLAIGFSSAQPQDNQSKAPSASDEWFKAQVEKSRGSKALPIHFWPDLVEKAEEEHGEDLTDRAGRAALKNYVSGPALTVFAGSYRIGKKAAGRELDGKTWEEYPG